MNKKHMQHYELTIAEPLDFVHRENKSLVKRLCKKPGVYFNIKPLSYKCTNSRYEDNSLITTVGILMVPVCACS